MRATVLLVVLGAGTPVLAQSRPGPGEVLIDSKQPPPSPEESTEVPLPPPGPEREAFLSRFLWVDPRSNEVSAVQGRLSPREFYQRVGRPDLAAWSEDRSRQRVWLMAGGGLTLVAGVVAGALVIAGGPDTSAPPCLPQTSPVYAECVDRSQRANTTGALLIGAGVALGGALIVWGITTPEMVTTQEETVRLAADYNLALSRKHAATGSRFQLVPSFAPGYAGLTGRLSF
ncbi:MAG TPA: hypothetical protein VMT11_09855 [Myxococcaceae bacterium]|nr:hypothetical protein [Myxococcaceae bacterium]